MYLLNYHSCTVPERRMAPRKWRKTKQQLACWPDLALSSCCVVFLHFLCNILWSGTVFCRAEQIPLGSKFANGFRVQLWGMLLKERKYQSVTQIHILHNSIEHMFWSRNDVLIDDFLTPWATLPIVEVQVDTDVITFTQGSTVGKEHRWMTHTNLGVA